jgi:hypothetical protein
MPFLKVLINLAKCDMMLRIMSWSYSDGSRRTCLLEISIGPSSRVQLLKQLPSFSHTFWILRGMEATNCVHEAIDEVEKKRQHERKKLSGLRKAMEKSGIRLSGLR